MVEDKLGDFEIKGEIGRGHMGVVYKAFDPNLHRLVAIKVMNTGAHVDEDLNARFLVEARAAARLNAPNIVGIYGMGKDDDRPFIIMEFVDGRDLNEVIAAKVFVPFEKKLDIVRQVCRGLAYAHENNVVHRDIKPSNVLLNTDGEAKITDFGLARLASSELTRPGMLLGTPYYMSPEQVKQTSQVDGRSDQFSLGVLIYEFLSYNRPFEAETPTQVMFKISTSSHPPLSEVLPGCSEELVRIVEKALENEPDNRFESCWELSQALLDFEKRLPSECEALAAEVKSLEERLPQSLNTVELVDDSVFKTDRRLRDRKNPFSFREFRDHADDYGCLMLRHADLTSRFKIMELIKNARSQFDNDELEACVETLEEIYQYHPDNKDARALEQQCRNLMEERRRERERQLQVSTALAVARNALNREDFERCLQAASAALEIDPEHREAQFLRMESKRRQKLEELVTKAHEYSKADRYETCLRMISEGLSLEPEHTQLRQLQKSVNKAWERQRKIEEYLDEACQKLEAKAYDDVVKAANEALALHPEEQRAQDLKDEAIRALERLNELLALARRQQEQQAYQACLETVGKGLELDPRHSTLIELQRSVEKAWQKQLEIESYLDESLRQMEAKAYEEAAEIADKVLLLDPRHPRAQELKNNALQALDELNRLLALARQQWQEKDHEACQETVKKGLALDPRHGDFKELQRNIQVEWERKSNIEHLIETASRQLEVEAYREAAETANKVLDLDPEQPRALHVKHAALRLGEIAAEREAQIKQLLDYARQQINSQNFDSAIKNLSFLLQLEPDHHEARDLLHQLEAVPSRPESEREITEPVQTSPMQDDDSLFGAEAKMISDEGTGISPAETTWQKVGTMVGRPEEDLGQTSVGTAGEGALEKLRQTLGQFGSAIGRVPVLPVLGALPSRMKGWATRLPLAAKLTLFLAAVLVGVALFLVYRSPEPPPPPAPPPPAPPGILVLEVSPWAHVESITRTEDGQVMPLTDRTTPLQIPLPEGSYLIRVANPLLGHPLELPIEVISGQKIEVTRTVPGFSLEEEIAAELESLEQ